MTQPPAKGARRITTLALLTAIALTIFMAEAQMAPVFAIPGIKLGLANIVTVYAVFVLGPGDALLILAARVFLGAVFSGQMSTIFYSGAGGLCAILITILSRKFLRSKQIWIAGVLGSIAHCIGQMAVAVALTGTPTLAAYLPVMILVGIFTGAFTGLCAQFLTERLRFEWKTTSKCICKRGASTPFPIWDWPILEMPCLRFCAGPGCAAMVI